MVHARRRHVRWDIVGRLAAGSIPGALLTIGILTLAQIDHAALARIVTQSLGVALILTACAIIAKPRIQQWGRRAAGRVARALDRSAHRRRRIRARRARHAVVGRCRRAGRCRAVLPLSAAVDSRDRRHRHCACRAAHAGSRTWACAARHRRLGPAGLAADRLAARNLARQHAVGARAGARAAVRTRLAAGGRSAASSSSEAPAARGVQFEPRPAFPTASIRCRFPCFASHPTTSAPG